MEHREPTRNASAADAERALIEAAKQDPARFAELYETNFERVYLFMLRRVRDRFDAEDLTSEVFKQALAGLQRFEWRGAPFSAWLFRIASNAIIDRSKREAKERGTPTSYEEAVEPRSDEIDEIEDRVRLARLVNELPTDQRRVVGMRFSEEKSIKEIAIEIGRSEGAVKQLQFRALQTLRSRLVDQPGDRNV
jgi:RNA polymerase sigma-70 factor (ECF subfamily)